MAAAASRPVVVTGGAGFIGSHVVEHLLGSGREVVVLDDLSTGSERNLDLRNGRLALVRGSVVDRRLVGEVMAGAGQVVHLAAVASVQASVEDPAGVSEVNAVGTAVVLREAMRAGVGTVALASSAAVYGTPDRLPVAEDAPLRPQSPYGADKVHNEHVGAFVHRSGSTRVAALRFFNVYGPRQDPSSPYSGVISRFAHQLAAGAPITVHGDGLQCRDFVAVADVVAAIARVLAWVGGPSMLRVNVGCGSAVTILDLVQTMGRVWGVRPEVGFGPPRSGDVRASVADVGRLRALGWAPGTTLQRGLERLHLHATGAPAQPEPPEAPAD